MIFECLTFLKNFWNDSLQNIRHFLLRILYLTFKSQKKTNPYPKQVKKILLIRRNRLGDAINLLPIIHAIKKNYPNVEINVLANQYNSQIFEYCSAISHIHILNEKIWLGQNFLFLNPIIKKLKKENFDLVIAFGGYTSRLAKITYFLKPKYSVGMGSNKFFFDLFYDKTVIHNKTKFKSQIEEMSALIKAARLTIPKNLPYTNLELLNRKNQKWLAICPEVTKLKTQYPIDSYKKIIKNLSNNKKFKKIILLVNNKNSAYIKLATYGAHLIKTKNLHDFINHLSKCTHVIASEGGAAHIAGALGLSICVISNDENRIYWRPYAKKVKVLSNKNGVKEISPEIITKRILSFK
jgi:ADP-heptose:LPS heptosyltransferase